MNMFVTNAQIVEHIGRRPEYEERIAELEQQKAELDRALSMMKATMAYLQVGEIYEQVALETQEAENGAWSCSYLGDDAMRGATVTPHETGVWHLKLLNDVVVGSIRDSAIISDRMAAIHAAKEWTAKGHVYREMKKNESAADADSNRASSAVA